MGWTNPTFRDRLRQFRAEWQPYHRALRKPHQKHFDALLEIADGFAAAAGTQNPVHAQEIELGFESVKDVGQNEQNRPATATHIDG